MTKYTVFHSAFRCWYYGILAYALLTTPALFIYVDMYLFSALLAFIGSIPAMLVFSISVLLAQRYKLAGYDRTEVFWYVLLGGIFAAFIGSLVAVYIITHGRDVLSAYAQFILFPIAGIGSAVISIWINKNKLFLTVVRKMI